MLCALFFTCVCECVRSITMTIKLQAAKERKYNFCKPIRNAGTKGEYSKQNQMINESSKQMLIKHTTRDCCMPNKKQRPKTKTITRLCCAASENRMHCCCYFIVSNSPRGKRRQAKQSQESEQLTVLAYVN